jgi:MFS superfamily sulfate permease-like transporter
VLVYRVDQPLIYFNVDHVRDDVVERVRAASPRPRLVVLELSLSPRLDLAAVNMLGELEEQLRLLGAELRLAEVHTQALERLRAEGIADRFRPGRPSPAPVHDLINKDTRPAPGPAPGPELFRRGAQFPDSPPGIALLSCR